MLNHYGFGSENLRQIREFKSNMWRMENITKDQCGHEKSSKTHYSCLCFAHLRKQLSPIIIPSRWLHGSSAQLLLILGEHCQLVFAVVLQGLPMYTGNNVAFNRIVSVQILCNERLLTATQQNSLHPVKRRSNSLINNNIRSWLSTLTTEEIEQNSSDK